MPYPPTEKEKVNSQISPDSLYHLKTLIATNRVFNNSIMDILKVPMHPINIL